MNNRSCEKMIVSSNGSLITRAPIVPLPLIKACCQFLAGLVLTNPRSGCLTSIANPDEQTTAQIMNPKIFVLAIISTSKKLCSGLL
jgi:hypothetical protein